MTGGQNDNVFAFQSSDMVVQTLYTTVINCKDGPLAARVFYLKKKTNKFTC